MTWISLTCDSRALRASRFLSFSLTYNLGEQVVIGLNEIILRKFRIERPGLLGKQVLDADFSNIVAEKGKVVVKTLLILRLFGFRFRFHVRLPELPLANKDQNR